MNCWDVLRKEMKSTPSETLTHLIKLLVSEVMSRQDSKARPASIPEQAWNMLYDAQEQAKATRQLAASRSFDESEKLQAQHASRVEVLVSGRPQRLSRGLLIWSRIAGASRVVYPLQGVSVRENHGYVLLTLARSSLSKCDAVSCLRPWASTCKEVLVVLTDDASWNLRKELTKFCDHDVKNALAFQHTRIAALAHQLRWCTRVTEELLDDLVGFLDSFQRSRSSFSMLRAVALDLNVVSTTDMRSVRAVLVADKMLTHLPTWSWEHGSYLVTSRAASPSPHP